MPSICRVGAVEFLNARPLLWGLERDRERFLITYDVPSALADSLAVGRLDVAIIPVAAYLEGVGGEIVRGVSISSQGAVGTVKLFARCPLPQVRTLALDRGSRTSVLLARAILAARYGVRPECTTVDPDLATVLRGADAAVVIGQDSLLAGGRPPEAVVEVDLGEEWASWQGLPLVTAVWAFREGWSSAEVAEALRDSRTRGLAALDEMARTEAAGRGLRTDIVRHYLGEMLDYRLEPDHARSIERYRDVLIRHGLLGQRRELLFEGTPPKTDGHVGGAP